MTNQVVHSPVEAFTGAGERSLEAGPAHRSSGGKTKGGAVALAGTLLTGVAALFASTLENRAEKTANNNDEVALPPANDDRAEAAETQAPVVVAPVSPVDTIATGSLSGEAAIADAEQANADMAAFGMFPDQTGQDTILNKGGIPGMTIDAVLQVEEAPAPLSGASGGGGTEPVQSIGVTNPGQPNPEIGFDALPALSSGMKTTISDAAGQSGGAFRAVVTDPAITEPDLTDPPEPEPVEDMILWGTGNSDALTGGAGNDALFGLDGDDILQGGIGADHIDGGAGTDIADYSDSAEAVIINLQTGEAGGGSATGDVLIDIEGVIGSNHDDTLTGLDGQTDFLSGGDGNDTIYALGGKDFLNGGAGADYLDGGEGNNDVAEYVGSAAGVDVSLMRGTGFGGEAEGDILVNIEFLHGSLFDDRLEGDDGVNRLEGRLGDDQLFGLGGDDRLLGGYGADLLDGGDGTDTADYSWSDHGVMVNLQTGTGSGGEAEGDALVSIEYLVGSSHNDVLTGDANVNRLWGGEGNDMLYGGGGNDRLDGGSGADHLDGGDGIDIADYSAALQGVMLSLATGGSGGQAAGDTYTSIENVYGSNFDDVITGDNGNNRLVGNAGNDDLSGGGGIDYLLGGLGDDTLTGGTGADVFLFEGEFNNDVITDFWSGAGRTDRIWLRDQGVNSWDQLQSAMSQDGSNVVITLDQGTITLENIMLDQLVQDDFILG